VYLATAQIIDGSLGRLLIRGAVPISRITGDVRRAIVGVDPHVRFAFDSFEKIVRESVQRDRMLATISSGFGLLAGLLSAIGLYGVISYTVARRRNEIGIRMALGAGRREITAMVLRESGRFVAIGVALGTVMSVWAARFADKLLFGIKPWDPGTLVLAALLLGATAAAATYVPARRAASVNPTTALRDD
jgi:putative ABC transport system permease protein